MWVKQCHKPPMTGNVKMVMTGGWFIVVLPTLLEYVMDFGRSKLLMNKYVSKSSKAPKEGAFRGAGGVIWCYFSHEFGIWYATEIIIPTWSSQPFGLQTHPARPACSALYDCCQLPSKSAAAYCCFAARCLKMVLSNRFQSWVWPTSLTLDFHCYIVYLMPAMFSFSIPTLQGRSPDLHLLFFFRDQHRPVIPPGLETANSGGFKMILSNHPGMERISRGFAWFLSIGHPRIPRFIIFPIKIAGLGMFREYTPFSNTPISCRFMFERVLFCGWPKFQILLHDG